MTVPKTEHSDEGSFSETSPEVDEQSFMQENVQVQKRKGGRKPIYATSEERKQRNRQAQAAFRERRTEYIKQLETTIKHHEEKLQNLQQSHRSAADECLMLRYKNSLLERILVEKRIDVQAELKSKTDGAHLGPHNIPSAGASQPFPLQRSVLNRPSQPRRSTIGPITKTSMKSHSASSTIAKHSPQLQTTPRSQTLSPTTAKSPTSLMQGGMTSPGVDLSAQQPQAKNRNHAPRTHSSLANSAAAPPMQTMTPSSRDGSRGSEMCSTGGTQKSYYPSPFQTHIEQLEQEYDAHADMLEDQDPNEQAAGPGPYPQTFHHQSLPSAQQLPPGMQGQPPMQPMHPPPNAPAMDPSNPAYGTMNQMFDPYDPMLDADPFGLTASMHFPTQFTFQESSMRQ